MIINRHLQHQHIGPSGGPVLVHRLFDTPALKGFKSINHSLLNGGINRPTYGVSDPSEEAFQLHHKSCCDDLWCRRPLKKYLLDIEQPGSTKTDSRSDI